MWFALYGRKGDPMVEMRGLDYRSTPMLHDGRFYQTMKDHGGPTLVSAVVFSMPRATVLMENPAPAKPLPPQFRGALLRTPHFRLDLSICEWEQGIVQATVASQRRTHASPSLSSSRTAILGLSATLTDAPPLRLGAMSCFFNSNNAATESF